MVFKAAIQRQGSIWACKLIIYNVEIIAWKLDLFKNPIMFMYLWGPGIDSKEWIPPAYVGGPVR